MGEKVHMKDEKKILWIVPLKRGKLSDTKENQKLKQNVWIGWEIMYTDLSSKNLLVGGEYNTLNELLIAEGVRS